MKRLLLFTLLATTLIMGAKADVDPNFHIYICFGQSNMEGNAQWETIDNQYVDPRFQMLATTNFDSPKRTLGNWYTAKCPIVSPQGKLGPTDYFGRTMVAAMPADVKIGVIAVAMGGSPIEMFDKDKYQQKLNANPTEWWATLAKNYYGGNPYGRIIEMAKKAQEVGVIKGILLHQGCSNCADPNWPNMVKKIYNDMLTDLGLKAADVPIFVGEVEYENMGGGCSSHNTQVARIPSVIPTGHVVSAKDLPGNGSDPWHFSATGYRMFGRRYAFEVLKVMGREPRKDPDYTLPANLQKFFIPKSFDNYINARAKSKITLSLWCTYNDGHREDLTSEATFTSDDFTITNGKLTTGDEAMVGTVTATVTDFAGTVHNVPITINVTGEGLGYRLHNLEDASLNHFAIVNEQVNKAFYCSSSTTLQFGDYDAAFQDTNAGYKFRLVSMKNNADPEVRSCYLIRLVKPNGSDYTVNSNPGYLNSQAANQSSCFIDGLNKQNGQSLKNGAAWDIQYVSGKGFTLRNMGTGLYLKDKTSAKYSEPTYFTFCTLGDAVTGIEDVEQFDGIRLGTTDVYNLQGMKVGTKDQLDNLPHGLYIVNGKKYFKQ